MDLMSWWSAMASSTVESYRFIVASFKAIGRAKFPSPFHQEAKTVSVSVRPDFIALGNFSGSSHLDLVLAASGDNVLYFFAGDGKGNFAAPQTVNVSGG